MQGLFSANAEGRLFNAYLAVLKGQLNIILPLLRLIFLSANYLTCFLQIYPGGKTPQQ